MYNAIFFSSAVSVISGVAEGVVSVLRRVLFPRLHNTLRTLANTAYSVMPSTAAAAAGEPGADGAADADGDDRSEAKTGKAHADGVRREDDKVDGDRKENADKVHLHSKDETSSIKISQDKAGEESPKHSAPAGKKTNFQGTSKSEDLTSVNFSEDQTSFDLQNPIEKSPTSLSSVPGVKVGSSDIDLSSNRTSPSCSTKKVLFGGVTSREVETPPKNGEQQYN